MFARKKIFRIYSISGLVWCVMRLCITDSHITVSAGFRGRSNSHICCLSQKLLHLSGKVFQQSKWKGRGFSLSFLALFSAFVHWHTWQYLNVLSNVYSSVYAILYIIYVCVCVWVCIQYIHTHRYIKCTHSIETRHLLRQIFCLNSFLSSFSHQEHNS